MNILIVSQYFWPESFKINDLSEELINRGHQVTVYTGLPNYPQGKFFKGYTFFGGPFKENYKGVEVVRIPIIPRGHGRGVQLILNFLYYGIIGGLLAPLLLRKKYDRIFIYGLSPIFLAIPGIILKKIWNIPVIFWVTDLWPESLVATGIAKKEFLLKPIRCLVKWIYKNTNLILTSSKGFIERIEKYDINRTKIKYWPQWAEAFFESSDKLDYSDDNFPEDSFVILFAGNIGEAQDMPNIIRAAEILKNEQDIKFVILGDGIKKKWAEAEVESKKLKNILFLGKKPIEVMPYYFKKANVLLVSLVSSDIFSITIPSKVQTYMASSKPLLAALNGEGAQIIEKSGAGIAVSSGESELLAQAVLKLRNSTPIELNRYGECAFSYYKSQFDRKKLIDQFVQYLQETN